MKLVITLVLLTSYAFAVGGICPSGANYHNPSNPTGSLVTLATLGATSCYFIAANGSDANDGLSEASGHPFLHAPGMTNCASSCASASITAGVWLIFRGGDTWHFGNTSATPAVGSQTWSYSHSGTSTSVRDGVTYDLAWFSGGSFARPIFSGDNTITTSRPASCTYDFNNVSQVNLGNSNHIYFDGFEFSGFCASEASDPNAGNVLFGGTDALVGDNYFHGFTVPTGCGTSCFDEQVAIHGTSGLGPYIGDLTNQCIFNVFDNSDGSQGTVGGGGTSTGDATLEAIQVGCAAVAYNVFARLSNGLVGISTTMHDNLFHDLYESHISSVHGNIWNVDNDSAANNGTQTFYNNVMYNIYEGVGVWFMPTQSGIPGYYFNNVSWSTGNSANCLMVGGTSQSTGLPTGSQIYIYNNTWDSPCNLRALNNGSDPKWNGTVFFRNNHFIGYGSPGTLPNVYSCDAGSTCTWTDSGNEIFQAEATANGQGYVTGNNYAPTLGTNSTVGAGSNQTSSCSTFSSDNALCNGTSGGVSEQSGWGGKIAVYPAITIIARPSSGAWDSGAYEFSAAAAAPAPSGSGVILISKK